MSIPWNLPLKSRLGGRSRLGGIDVFYDFDWLEVFGHVQGAFRHGQRLAQLVKGACPPGKKPVLLLTTQDEVGDQTIHMDDLFVVVVPIRRYLADSAPDPAASYFARRLTSVSGSPSLPRLSELVRTTSDLDSILQVHLDEEALRRWAGSNTERISALQRLGAAYSAVVGAPSVTTADLARTLDRLESLPPELLDALVNLAKNSGQDVLKSLAEGLTSSSAGRQVTAETLAERVTDRLRDARKTANEYSALLSNPASTETDLQTFIERFPWILGLEYVKITGRRQVVRGAVDFLVQRHDGFHDFLELKSPNAELVQILGRPREGIPNAPSGYSLGPELAQALAQVQYYKDMFVHQENAMATYGIRRTRFPRALIVVGRYADLDETRQTILHQMNQSLHRVEILAYDVLAKRVAAQLDSIERLFAQSTNLTDTADEGSAT